MAREAAVKVGEKRRLERVNETFYTVLNYLERLVKESQYPFFILLRVT